MLFNSCPKFKEVSLKMRWNYVQINTFAIPKLYPKKFRFFWWNFAQFLPIMTLKNWNEFRLKFILIFVKIKAQFMPKLIHSKYPNYTQIFNEIQACIFDGIYIQIGFRANFRRNLNIQISSKFCIQISFKMWPAFHTISMSPTLCRRHFWSLNFTENVADI